MILALGLQIRVEPRKSKRTFPNLPESCRRIFSQSNRMVGTYLIGKDARNSEHRRRIRCASAGTDSKSFNKNRRRGIIQRAISHPISESISCSGSVLKKRRKLALVSASEGTRTGCLHLRSSSRLRRANKKVVHERCTANGHVEEEKCSPPTVRTW